MTWIYWFVASLIGLAVGVLVTHCNMDGDLAREKEYGRILEHKNSELDRDLHKAITAFEELSSFLKETPDDCKLGPWCQGCQYSRIYSRYIGTVDGCIKSFYCGKKEVCKHFTQLEDEK